MKTVGIGSLPHRSVLNAVNYSLKHDLPFLPQMTSLGERMIPQVLANIEMTEKYQALTLFTEKLLEKKVSTFKIQLAGPETCNVENKIIMREINSFLNYFDQFNLRPIIFIDEPIITLKTEQLKNIFSELTNLQIISGLHSCAKFNWDKVENMNFDFLSFDAQITIPMKQTKKNLITGIPPFSKEKFQVNGTWISSSCGLARYSEDDCEKILLELNNYK